MKRILQPIFLRIARSLGISEIQSVLDNLHNDMKNLRDGCDAMSSISERRTIETRDALLVGQAQLAADFHDEIVRLSRKTDSLSATTHGIRTENVIKTGTMQEVDNSQIEDSFYMALEDHFRGSEISITERQETYIPMVMSSISDIHALLDIGCGRGEWLALLKDKGISSWGIDTNSASIEMCTAKGLDVRAGDLRLVLPTLEEGSLGAVTMFQVMEHLTFPVLIDTFRQILRILRPGGVLIAEVPNAKNLRVSAGTFWIDPTHQRPLYPELLLFLAREVGYSGTEGLYLNKLSPDYDLSSLAEGPRAALESVVNAVDTFGDFALIARK